MGLAIIPKAAGQGVTPRPLSNFLENQGQSQNFFPPVQDYVGWTDGPFVQFALIDYAGLAAEWLKETSDIDLHTRVGGNVTQRTISYDSGLYTVEITITLRTANALGFAQYIEDIFSLGFLGAPTIFGAKAQDVADPAIAADPATGWAHLDLTFTMQSEEPVPDLPNLLELFDTPEVFRPASFEFESKIIDTQRPGSPNVSLHVHQVASIGEGEPDWTYDTEDIEIEELGN